MRFFVLIFIILIFSCKAQFNNRPMSNLELARYIKLIEFRRQISLHNYIYLYNTQRNFDRLRNINANLNNIYNSNYKNNTFVNIPQTATVGNTTVTPNVQPPISNGNIKTNQ
jgi:hypothetical protein